MTEISIVVPVHNENENIKPFLQRTEKILDKMKNVEQKLRVAKFISVICSVGFRKDFFLSKCILLGEIYHKAVGKNGFGYDPIFFIPKKNKTFAMMTEEQKNEVQVFV